eukprot:scaffold140374_cov36-Prasinocladus_malaysianus.AAC.1
MARRAPAEPASGSMATTSHLSLGYRSSTKALTSCAASAPSATCTPDEFRKPDDKKQPTEQSQSRSFHPV